MSLKHGHKLEEEEKRIEVKFNPNCQLQSEFVDCCWSHIKVSVLELSEVLEKLGSFD